MQTRRWMGVTIMILAVGLSGALTRASAEDLTERVQQMEQELEQLKRELREQKASQDAAHAQAPASPAAATQASEPALARELLDRVKLGAYGSMRFEHSSLDDVKNTFTLRRLVLTTDANIAPRLRAAAEIEFEHFRKLELEKELEVSDGGLRTEQAVEGSSDSEISLEQAWLQYDLQDWLRFRTGALLVPVGRFNIAHDDNRWDLPRRSLVDRGVAVLPSKAAWDELGVGFNGDIPITDTLLGSYQLYVMNGVTLDSSIETVAEARVGDTTLIEEEVELSPEAGTFNLDTKDAKAVSGRFALSPSLGSELATSFYWGRYTPDFLPNETLYSLSADGKFTHGPFEVEGEYVYTHFGGVDQLAREFAATTINTESALENDLLEHEVDFELARLASDKQGYWIDLRYRFWPAALNATVFGRPFANPQLIATVRGEQAWLGGLVRSTSFSNGTLTDFTKENRRVDRVTLGATYRPVPLVAFQLAYEYTRTDAGKSLSDVTNFLPAHATENDAHALLIGTTFGF